MQFFGQGSEVEVGQEEGQQNFGGWWKYSILIAVVVPMDVYIFHNSLIFLPLKCVQFFVHKLHINELDFI